MSVNPIQVASGKVDYTDEEMETLKRKFEDAVNDPQILIAMRQSASVVGGSGVILAQLKKLAHKEGLLFHNICFRGELSYFDRHILYRFSDFKEKRRAY